MHIVALAFEGKCLQPGALTQPVCLRPSVQNFVVLIFSLCQNHLGQPCVHSVPGIRKAALLAASRKTDLSGILKQWKSTRYAFSFGLL